MQVGCLLFVAVFVCKGYDNALTTTSDPMTTVMTKIQELQQQRKARKDKDSQKHQIQYQKKKQQSKKIKKITESDAYLSVVRNEDYNPNKQRTVKSVKLTQRPDTFNWCTACNSITKHLDRPFLTCKHLDCDTVTHLACNTIWYDHINEKQYICIKHKVSAWNEFIGWNKHLITKCEIIDIIEATTNTLDFYIRLVVNDEIK